MKKKLYEDATRVLLETDREDEILLKLKDDIIDYRGTVKGNAKNKASVNAAIAVHLFKLLYAYHVPTCFKSQKSAKELVLKKADAFPFKIVVVNDSDKNAPNIEYLSIDESLETKVSEKKLVSDSLVDEEQLSDIRRIVLKINVLLKDFFDRRGIECLGFSIQLGMINDNLGVCSELCLDTCDVKEKHSRVKFTSTYMSSHLESAVELYDQALNMILY